MHVHALVCVPAVQEKSDAQLFANNVRIKMSEAIPAVLTEHWMEDARLLDEAAKIGMFHSLAVGR
jgi:hypothetical protein